MSRKQYLNAVSWLEMLLEIWFRVYKEAIKLIYMIYN